MTAADLAALERLLAEATKTACDRATPCTSLCWRSVPACVPSAAVQRVLAERDALRAEVERMRAVVEAAVAVRARACAIGGGVTTVRTRDMSILGIKLDAMSALDAAKEGEK